MVNSVGKELWSTKHSCPAEATLPRCIISMHTNEVYHFHPSSHLYTIHCWPWKELLFASVTSSLAWYRSYPLFPFCSSNWSKFPLNFLYNQYILPPYYFITHLSQIVTLTMEAVHSCEISEQIFTPQCKIPKNSHCFFGLSYCLPFYMSALARCFISCDFQGRKYRTYSVVGWTFTR